MEEQMRPLGLGKMQCAGKRLERETGIEPATFSLGS